MVISDAPMDGRSARRQRTREAIIEAVSDLIDEGILTPTLARIADRAGVSLRSVTVHFEDRERLLAAVADRHLDRIVVDAAPIDTTGDLPARVDAFLAQRTAILERLTHIARASQIYEQSSEEVRRRRQHLAELGRREVARVFRPELRRGDGVDRQLLAATDVACGSGTWSSLRESGLDVDDARAVLRRMLLALLAG